MLHQVKRNFTKSKEGRKGRKEGRKEEEYDINEKYKEVEHLYGIRDHHDAKEEPNKWTSGKRAENSSFTQKLHENVGNLSNIFSLSSAKMLLLI